MMRSSCAVAVALMLMCGGLAVAQTTIETDGEVKAQGFDGDGSKLTNVDAATLDGNDSTDFAGATGTAAVIAALQAQVAELLSCRGRRFLDMGDGTVLDCNTRLFWLKDASCADLAGTDAEGQGTWVTAQSAAAALADGTCSLTDGSSAGDWRQPTIREWCSAWSESSLSPCPASAAPTSMIDSLAGPPTIPTPHPFVGVQSSFYWSSSSDVTDSDGAWAVRSDIGNANSDVKDNHLFVWPVRGGQ